MEFNLPNCLLSYAPHGLFVGCGGTSEFICYILRNYPLTDDQIFEVARQSSQYDTAIDIIEYNYPFNDVIDEIKRRIKAKGYVRINFDNFINYDDEVKKGSINESIKDAIFKKCLPRVFDHSFIITKSKDCIYRYESYIREYAPKKREWNDYEEDLEKLLKIQNFDELLINWKEIFGVQCDTNQEFDFNNIKIIINN